MAAQQGDEEFCSICLDSLLSEISALSCGHTFHKVVAFLNTERLTLCFQICIQRWFDSGQSNGNCPNCRRFVNPDAKRPEPTIVSFDHSLILEQLQELLHHFRGSPFT